MSPVKEAVYWIEYVAKYGKVLQPASAHMPFYQLYLIDVFAFVVVSIGMIWKLGKTVLVSLWFLIGHTKDAKSLKQKRH